MLAHPGVALALVLEAPDVLRIVNLALAGGLLAATATVFARAHRTLTPAGTARLLRLDAGRVVAWTASLGVAAALALSA